tara:strand:- start:376 stop:561 length:186 start_codon:yes stop_codon:yes gene_type:complete
MLKMEVNKKSVIVKGYNRKHTITIEETKISGYTFISLLKNGNPIIKCTPKEFIKLKKLFIE